MESHIPYNLNIASRNKDVSKVATLGPISCLLNDIIRGTENKHRYGDTDKLNNAILTDLWRGLTLDDLAIQEHI